MDNRMDDKQFFKLSGSTTFRRREPTNPKVAAHFTQMVFDHSQQHAVMPDAVPDAIVESSHGNQPFAESTMNINGIPPLALKVMVGGSPDYHGPEWRPGQSDMSSPPQAGRVGPKETPFGTLHRRRSW